MQSDLYLCYIQIYFNIKNPLFHDIIYMYGKCSKIPKTVPFLFSNKIWFSGLGYTKCSSEYQIGKTLIRLLLQKQSDLGLHCFSRHFRRRHVFEI